MSDSDPGLDAIGAKLAALDGEPAGEDQVQETPDANELIVDDTASTPEPAADEPQELIAGKYKNIDEALRAVDESQQAIGRMKQEVGERRQREQELTERLAALEQSTRQPTDYDNLIIDDPAAAAEKALTEQDGPRFQQALAAWNEVAPGAPKVWLENLQLRDQMNQLSERVNVATAPANNMAVQHEQQQALRNLSGRYEDFDQVIGNLQDETRINELVQAGFPAALLDGLDEPGRLPQREQMLATLYAFAKTAQAGPLKTLAAEAVKEAQNETRAAKREATLPASSTGTVVSAEPDGVTKFKDAFRQNFGLPRLLDE